METVTGTSASRVVSSTSGAHALGDDERALEVGLRQEDAELVPAEARRHVVLAGRLLERLGDPDQRPVARDVAVGGVDVPEVVDIDHEERHRPVETARATELLAERRLEVPEVVEAGLRLDPGRLDERRDRERAVRERERHERQRDEARIVAPRGRPRSRRARAGPRR